LLPYLRMARRCYCGLLGGTSVIGLALVAGFFLAGFLGGAVSSTTIFFGGCALALACAFCSATRSRFTSASLVPARVSTRSATERRDFSNALTSFSRDWNSSLEPNAP